MPQPENDSGGRRAPSAAGWLGRIAVALGAGLIAVRFMPSAALPVMGQSEADATDERTGRGHAARPPSARARKAGHETEDMDARTMSRLVIGLGVAVAVMVFAMIGLGRMFTGMEQRARPGLTAEQTTRIVPPAPNLQADPVKDLATLHANEDVLLNTYGWTDAAHTRARIPIERAMSIVVGRKLDAAP